MFVRARPIHSTTPALLAAALLAAALLAACGGQKPAPEPAHLHEASDAVWVNGDFETGDLTGWTVQNYINPILPTASPTSFSGLGLTAGGAVRTYNRTGAAETVIPAGLTAASTLRVPRFGTHVAVVNELGSGRNANAIRQTMTVGTADVDPSDGKPHLRFAIAPVLQNPGHSAQEQPYFFIEMNNLTRGTQLFHTFNFSNQAGVPWKSDGGTLYTDWQSIDIAPGPASLAVGDQVEVIVVAAGCSQGGHYGHVYIDGLGPVLPGLAIVTSGPSSVNAGATMTYTASYRNDGAGTATNVIVEQTLPANTTFASLSAPGATCTTPAVGAAGVISCNVGSLNPSSSGSFTFTVTVAPAATGTINHGNYNIRADGVSALIGPLWITSVTAGVTYADLSVTKTDGTAAMNWGATTTYTIVVSNSGPSAVAGAWFSDPVPANVASQTWTCTPAGGATCATASGSGSPDQALGLPVGSSVTFSVVATAVAGSGPGTIRNLATIAVPGGVTDSRTDNDVAVDYTDLGALYVLTVEKADGPAGHGTGRVVSVPGGIDCAGACASDTASYVEGSSVTLTAAADAGSSFAGWTGGGCSGMSAACTVTMDAAKTVTAAFGPQTWVLSSSATGNGLLSCTPAVALDGASATCTVTPAAGLTALTDNGANVLGSVAGGVYTIPSVTTNHTVVATFYTLTTGAFVQVSGNSQSAPVATAFGAPICVEARTAGGAAIVNEPVTFTAPASGARATLSASIVSTDAAGVACVSATANTAAGTYLVTATADGFSATAATLTNLPGAPAAVAFSVVASAVQSTAVGTGFGLPLAIVVRDAHGNPIPGVAVTYALRDPGAAASATLSATDVTTNASGVASITATANTVPGAYVVDVTVAGLTVPAEFFFALQNVPGAPATIVATPGGTPQSAEVGGNAFANPLAVEVRDAYANPIPGATVNWAAPVTGARALLSAASTTTDAAGLTSVTATTGDVAGAYTVTASTGGLDQAFLLTNTPGAPATFARLGGDAQHTTVDTAFAVALSGRVDDAFGNPVPGVLVSFTVPGSGATAVLSASSASTDASGVASVTATAGTVAGAYQVGAAAAGVAAPLTYDLENDPGAPASVTHVAGSSPQAAEVGGNPFTNPLAVIVRDGFGNPVPGVTVTFDAPVAGARAVLSATSATTDASGAAEVTGTTGNVAGSYVVTATIPGELSETFALTNTVGPPSTLVLVTGDGQTATVDAAFADALAVRVDDAFGNPVPGVLVGYEAPATGARAVLSATGLTTDAAGTASVTATAGTVAGAYQVTATATGVAAPVVFDLVNAPGAPAAVTAAPLAATQSAEVGTAYGQPLAVTVRDLHGNVVPGVTVTFAAPGAGATAALSAGTATTAADGTASVTATASLVSGAYAVTASVDGVATPASFALTNLAGAPTTVATDSGTPQEAVVDAAYAQALGVIVRDAHGNPVPGATVAYAAPATGATVALSAASATTGADGRASVTATAGTVAGAFQVTATVDGAASPVQFALTNLPGAPANVVGGAGASGQSTRVGEAFAAALSITVTDSHGNPVPGVTVAFACPATGTTCELSAASAVTGADGRVQVTATAGTTPGGYAATGTVAGLPAVSFELTNLVGLPGSIAIVSGGAQTAGVYEAFGAPLRVVVKDAYQNVVPEVTVSWQVVSAGDQEAVLSAATTDTDEAGEASVTATANFAKGSYDVRASAPGVATPAAFALQNTSIATVLELEVGLPVFSTVVTEGGVTRLTVAVGPEAGGAPPTGTITVTSTRAIGVAPGQPGASQSGAGVVTTLVDGAATLDVLVKDWRSQELTVAYTPDAGAAQTWDPVSVTRALHAAERKQDHDDGGCSSGGGGGLAALPLLLLALRGARVRRRFRP